MKKQLAYNTNLASEFHVLSVLHRLGMAAYLTLGNKKSVDIAVVRDVGDSVTIDVKGVAGKNDWLVGRPVRSPREGHFAVLVTYNGKIEQTDAQPECWVLPDREFLSLIQTSSTSTAWYIRRKTVLTDYERFKSAWHLIREKPVPMSR